MVRQLWFVALLAPLAACAPSAPNVKCDGEVFFVHTGCHEVASTAATPVRSGTGPGYEPGPSSQPEQPAQPQPPAQQRAPQAQPVPRSAAPQPAPEPVAQPTPQPTPPSTPQPVVPPTVNVVYFALGSATLGTDTKHVLSDIADYLKQVPDDKVSLYGFSDPTGSMARNKSLIATRVKNVREFLAELGVAEDRVEIPSNSLQTPPKSYPSAEFWRLRKVLVNYSSKALAVAAEHEKQDEAEAENDGRTEREQAAEAAAVARQPKQPKAKHAAKDKEAPAEPGLQRIDVMYWKSTNHSLLILAKALGYFADEGFDVRLHEANSLEANQISVAVAEGTTTVRAPSTAMDLNKKNKYFMGAVCPLGLHDALNKNLPVVQIGGMLANPNTVIMKKELVEKVKKSLLAFQGHTIARIKKKPSDVDYTDLFLNPLRANHVEWKEKWYPTFADCEEAVARGEADAAMSLPPYDEEFIERHTDLGIYELRGVYSTLPCCRQLVTREQLKTARQKYVKFERAIIRAHEFYRENKAETVDIVAKVLKMNPSIVRAVFSRPGYDLDPNPNLKGSVAFAKTLKSSVGNKDVREAVDTSVYEEALLSLASEHPSDDYYKQAIKVYRATN